MQDVHIGPLPPPLGGISVHLYRRSKLEKNAIFIDEKKITGSIKILFWLVRQLLDFKTKKNYIYHYYSPKMKFYLFLLSLISKHEVSYVIHGRSFISQYKRSNIIGKFLLKKMYNKAKFIQVVNPSFKLLLNKIGINNKRIFVKNAFIPPPEDDELNILKTYENKVLNFLEFKNPILLANAFALKFYNGEDLYGFDLCIELINLLKKIYPEIGFLFALPDDRTNLNYLEQMKKRIKDYGIENNFYIMTGQRKLWPLLKKVDLFLRPTNTDGDAISIREAIFFNVPVIASDITIRPKECILFKNRNLEDLYEKTLFILKKFN